MSLRAGSRWAQASRQTVAQIAGTLVELDRGRVAADVLVEVMEVVLGLLEPVDQVERLGPVADGQGEHLQAGLAALQGVAALVRQPGDHLADGGQPLGLQCPLLRLLEERDVLADLEDRGAILVVGQVACVPDDPAARAVAADDRVLEAAGGAAGDDPRELLGDGRAVGLGQEQLEVIAPVDLVGRVAGELLGERAEVDDRVVGPEDDDHALGGLDQVAEGGLAPLLGQGELPAARRSGPGWCGARRRLSGLRM